mgnify:CR=1 FL=1
MIERILNGSRFKILADDIFSLFGEENIKEAHQCGLLHDKASIVRNLSHPSLLQHDVFVWANKNKEGRYDAVVIFGSTLNLKNAGGYSFIGGRCFRTDKGQKEDYKKGTHQHCGRGDGPYYEDYFVYTDNGCNRGDIDICDQDISYHGLVHGSYDGGWSIKDDTRNKIETSWNKAGTEMRYVKKIGN